MIQKKNRERNAPTFANINLLGLCNIDCYFCLGKDLPEHFNKTNSLSTKFEEWKNFDKFLDMCKKDNIKKIYLTGQNTDPLMYDYLKELILFLQEDLRFEVGIRTNGYNAIAQLDTINLCKEEIGYTINSLDYNINYKIVGKYEIPDWNYIIPRTKPKCRVSVVVNKYNIIELYNIIQFVSTFDNVNYLQLRRISTDTRVPELEEDIALFETFFNSFKSSFIHQRQENKWGADIFNLFGKEISFWRTIQTDVNSYNYYTDGVFSDSYFIIEGYLKNL